MSHLRVLGLVLVVCALCARLIGPAHSHSRSSYRHGSLSISGVYPNMPDEEIEKEYGPATSELHNESAGHTHVYGRDGEVVVEFDSTQWTALDVKGKQLEKDGVVVLQAGDSEAKARQVLATLSPKEPVEQRAMNTGVRLSISFWDGLNVECKDGRVCLIHMLGH